MKPSHFLIRPFFAASLLCSASCNSLFGLDAPALKHSEPEAGAGPSSAGLSEGEHQQTGTLGGSDVHADSGASSESEPLSDDTLCASETTQSTGASDEAAVPTESSSAEAGAGPVDDAADDSNGSVVGSDASAGFETEVDGAARPTSDTEASDTATSDTDTSDTASITPQDAGSETTDEPTDTAEPECEPSDSEACQCEVAGEPLGEVCTPPCDGCLIGETCLADGTLHSTNPCFVCDVEQSANGWVANTGALCGAAADECSAQDTCNAAAQCEPNHLASGLECGDPGYECDGAGACVSACAAEQRFCDGECRDVNSNRLHCGACDVVCALNGVCAEGECSFPEDISVLDLEAGQGGFTLDGPLSVCGGILVDALGDLNADGKAEFVTAGFAGGVIVLGDSHDSVLSLEAIGTDGVRITNSVDPRVMDGMSRFAGDVNGDGRPDLVAYLGDAISGEHRVLFTPSGALSDVDLGTTTLGGFTIEQPVDGYSVARGGGDVNGDGRDDLLVWQEGAVFVVFGKQTATAVPLSALPQGAGLRFEVPTGATLAEADRVGDVNGDGKDDVVVGYPQSGVASIIFGRTGGWGAIYPDAPGEGGIRISGAAELGKLVSPAGDFNGDGSLDVLVSTGAATWVIFGQTTHGTLDVSALGSSGVRIGGTVSELALAGDVNGDGYSDVLLADRDYGPDREGAVYVIFGAPGVDALELSALGSRGQRITGFRSDDNVGSSIAGGDFDGDGFDDIVIGTSCPQQGISEVYVVYGVP